MEEKKLRKFVIDSFFTRWKYFGNLNFTYESILARHPISVEDFNAQN